MVNGLRTLSFATVLSGKLGDTSGSRVGLVILSPTSGKVGSELLGTEHILVQTDAVAVFSRKVTIQLSEIPLLTVLHRTFLSTKKMGSERQQEDEDPK